MKPLNVRVSEFSSALYNRASQIEEGDVINKVDLELIGVNFQVQRLSHINRLELAAEYYRKAIQADNNNYLAYCHLGVLIQQGVRVKPCDLKIYGQAKMPLLRDIDKWDLAAEYFRQTLLIYPQYSNAWSHLGVCIVNGAKLKPLELLDSRFQNQFITHVERLELAAELYRKAIRYDVKNSDAYFNLAICIYKGAKIQQGDLHKTKFSKHISEHVKPAEFIVELLRCALRYDPKHSNAYCYLARYIQQGTQVENSDLVLVGDKFQNQALSSINCLELAAAFNQRALVSDANNSMAYNNLAVLIKKGVNIQATYLIGTQFEGTPPSEIDKNELAAELYRKAIAANPNYYLAYKNLAVCIKEGATIQESDFKKTQFQGVPLIKVLRDELIAALATIAETIKNGEAESGPVIIYNFSMQQNTYQGIRRALNKLDGQKVDFPDHLCCPITLEVMVDPVIAADGETYARSFIEDWFKRGHTTSPMNAEKHLMNTTLTPNLDKRREILDYLEKLSNPQQVIIEQTKAKL